MKIRVATLDDAPAISRLVRRLLEAFVAYEFSDEGRSTLLASCTPESIAGYMRSAFRFHVAEVDGELVGAVGVRDDRHLFHLFVAETHQRQGIGRALWEVARNAAEKGNSGAGFTVNSSRHAVPAYRSFGFVETGPPEERHGVVSVPMRRMAGDGPDSVSVTNGT